jgi:N-acetylglutamate synthase-like GNAT family acetyltransferase
MAGENSDDMLRAMAQHRGFRLVRSRRRKPGTGDYGRYGLTEGDKEIFGFGANGLAATAEEIASFLRRGELSAWGESISKMPAQSKSVPASKPAAEPQPASPPPQKRPPTRSKPRTPVRRPAPSPSPRAPPPLADASPAPALSIRTATRGDAESIATLLTMLDGIDVDAKTVADRLALSNKGSAAVLVAQEDGVIGCVAWQVIQTLHRGPIGRITLLLVASGARRRGVGTSLIEAAKTALEKQGCVLMEAVSDIEIRNSHGFFRALGFKQSSYRFSLRL